MSKTEKNSNKTYKDKRQGVLKLYSVGTSVILVVILVVFNILFENILGKYLTFDFSLSGYNEVQQPTIDYLNSLPADTNIRIVGLFEKPETLSNSPLQFIVPLLDSYVKESKGKITVEYYDPKTYPSIINQLDPKGMFDLQSDTYAVSNGSKVVSIDPFDCFTYETVVDQSTGSYKQSPSANIVEYTFDNAIYRLTSGITHKAYFVTGLRNDTSEQLKTILNSMGFDNADLQASGSFTVPEDCDILFINGAQTDIPEGMISPIKDYLFNRNGKLIISVDYSENNINEKYSNLNNILENYNIAIDSSWIIEGNPNYQLTSDGTASLVDVASDFAQFTSSRQLRSSMNRSIRELSNPSSSILTEAVLTSSSYAVTVTPENTDLNNQGTYNVGMYGTFKDNAESSKVLVFGTMSFTSDDYISSFGYNDSNVEFTRGCIRYLTGISTDNTLQVNSKPIDSYKIDSEKVTSTNNTIMTVIFMVVVPLGLVIAAVVVYKLRKNL